MGGKAGLGELEAKDLALKDAASKGRDADEKSAWRRRITVSLARTLEPLEGRLLEDMAGNIKKDAGRWVVERG